MNRTPACQPSNPTSIVVQYQLPETVVLEGVRLWLQEHHPALGLRAQDLALISFRVSTDSLGKIVVKAEMPRSVPT